MAQPWLGLAMIVRDAEATIKTLLNSIDGVFDEVVFVDTGSKDKTRRIIADHYLATWDGPGRHVSNSPARDCAAGAGRVVFASFDWVDDFSKARQFSFDLLTSKWRMYLDADDDATDLQRKLRPTLERTEKTVPEINCVSLKYNYVAHEMAQDKVRLVRWADGWKWEDPVHEHLVRSQPNQGKTISVYQDVWVKHAPTEATHANKSWDRNLRIQEAAYANPERPEKKALWAYYLANYAFEAGKFDIARKYYREVGDDLGRNNITCEGLCRWARMEIKLGNVDKAMDLAAEAIGKAPELPDGITTLAIAHSLSGAHFRATGLFDALIKQPPPPMETQHDSVWLDGLCWVYAAISYYQMGRPEDAKAAINRIPGPLLQHPEIIAAGKGVQNSLAKTDGFNRLQALWEYLIWDTEPLKAKRLLEEFCPAAISDSPQVQGLIRQMDQKLDHMKDWRSYQRAYAAIPELPYHVPKEHHAWTLTQGRARMVRQWAENLPKEGPPIEVLVIGVQDGIIETAMMQANPRLVLTACDVAPQASVGINEMMEKFPGRVKTHALVEDHFDWFPVGSSFDAVILFEVLEHLPDAWADHDCEGDAYALRLIRERLNPGGQLFLSTPIAASWVEHYLSDLKDPRPWWHVRAHNPTTLWNLFRNQGFTGSLIGLGDETLFLAKMTPASSPRSVDEVSIYVYPLGAHGFDPFSPKTGAVGGSEEAVIHLSAALARKGHKVTVYTDSPKRKDQVLVHEGVQWRAHSEFDAGSMKGTLLVWRAPQMAAIFKRQNPRLKVLSWLHDTHYACKPEVYQAADGVVVLSKFHAKAVEQFDGFKGPFLYASNGIVPSEFPEPDESKRDPHAAIYAAAPERGLDLLLAAWPAIRKAVPDATLRIYYSWVLTEETLKKRPNAELSALLAHLRGQFEALKDQGVTYIGGVDHKTLNEAYRTSGVWAFPPHHFNEISCISALRAQASGCWPVIIPTGALPETCPHGDHVPLQDITPEAYAKAVVYRMLKPPPQVERKEMREWALQQNWDKAADQFISAFNQKNERITIFAGGFGRRFSADGSADGKPLGGSEEAVIAMSKALVQAGKQVFVYAPLPQDGESTIGYDGATWLDASTFDPAGPHGVLLAWRCPSLMPKFKGNGYQVVLWLMDPHYQARAFDYAEADDVVFLTKAHRGIIQRNDGYDGGGSVVHIGLPELPPLGSTERQANAVMWATSPDRGLLEFLRDEWPKVVKEVPSAVLRVFYGLEPLERAGKLELVAAIRAEMTKHSDSVVYHGGVSDAELYKWYQRCSVFAFPCRDFEETQSLSTLKAAALGCFPVVNATGCLPEVVSGSDGFVVTEDYGKTLATILKNPPSRETRVMMSARARENYSVQAMVTKMLKVIEDVG